MHTVNLQTYLLTALFVFEVVYRVIIYYKWIKTENVLKHEGAALET